MSEDININFSKSSFPEGVITVDKPRDYTSFDIVAIARRCYNVRKIGHGGTLDPLATGVLPIFIGRCATRLIDRLPDKTKTYTAEFRLGLTTNTQDITGEVLRTADYAGVSVAEVDRVLDAFRGEFMQLPPMFSAVKVNGQRLYKAARAGVDVPRVARTAVVTSLKLTRFSPESGEGEIALTCGAGTYVRAIIHDMGVTLGCGAVMTALTRTVSHGFELSGCVSVDELKRRDAAVFERIIPVQNIEKLCILP